MAVKDDDKDKAKPGTGAGSKTASRSSSRASSKTASKPAGKTETDKTAASGRRRPAQMIDLKAEEVETKAEKATEAKTKTDSAKSSSVPKAGAKDGNKGEQTEKKKGSARKAAKPTSAEPPQRTQPGEIRGFVTHLAAGLVGGVIGVVGMGYGLGQMPAGLFGDAEKPAAGLEELTALEKKVTALETGMATLKERAAAVESNSVKPEALAALDTRLAETKKTLAAQSDAGAALDARLAQAEKALAAQDSARAPLKERLDGLEKTLATLRESAAEGGDVAQTAAIAARIDAVASQLEARIKTIEAEPAGPTAEDIATLRKDVEARIGEVVAKVPTGADPEEIAKLRAVVEAQSKKLADLPDVEIPNLPADLTTRLTGLEKSLGRIEAGQAEKARAAALAAGFAALTKAAEGGSPFAGEIEALGKLAPENVSLDALATLAETGAPTLTTLQQRFDDYRRAAQEAAKPEGKESSLVGRLLDNAKSVVRVRRIDAEGGDAGSKTLSQMASLLKGGDLQGALQQAETLPEDKKKTLSDWISQAKARIELDTALKSVSEQLASAAAGPR